MSALNHVIDMAHVFPPISTYNGNLVDALGHRVGLQCVNWYGLHTEYMSLLGPVPQIAESIKQAGFNCVQLPFSTELVLRDRLTFMDDAVEQLTSRGLMVILNSHTNKKGWCCDMDDENGVWNIKGDEEFTTEAWMWSLETLANRYKDNKLVIGIDLKNEIHNTRSQRVTWGYSKNTDMDWKAASENAATRVHSKNKDILILVEGLCYALNMGPLYANPPKFPLSDTKLVYSVHMYPWSTPWSVLEETFANPLWIIFAILMFVGNSALLWWVIPKVEKLECIVAVHTVTIALVLCASILTFIAHTYQQIGCYIREYETAYVVLVMLSLLAILAHIVFVPLFKKIWTFEQRSVILTSSFVFALQPIIVVLFLFIVFQEVRTGLIYEEMASTLINPQRTVPLIMGEFGMSTALDERNSAYWQAVTRLIKFEGMSWVYWPLNAFKKEGEVETFGLLQGDDYHWVMKRLRELPW